MLIFQEIFTLEPDRETDGYLCQTQAGQRKSTKTLGRRKAVPVHHAGRKKILAAGVSVCRTPYTAAGCNIE